MACTVFKTEGKKCAQYPVVQFSRKFLKHIRAVKIEEYNFGQIEKNGQNSLFSYS